jgi:site-specific DNA recombinase
MQEKSEQGTRPSQAPLGYRNVAGPDGKKIIAVDPESAPIVANLFEWYAIGTILLQEATRKARVAGPARTSSATLFAQWSEAHANLF